MKVKVYFDKEDEVFLTEEQMNERKAELAQEMTDYPRDYDDVSTIIDDMSIEELWEAFTPEAKKNIINEAVKRWFDDTDYYVEGEIDI